MTDDGAAWDKEVVIDAASIVPQVSWGTNPGQVTGIDGAVPSPGDYADPTTRETVTRALEYMDLAPGTPIRQIEVDTVFIGSCTNSRIEDLRAAAEVMRGRQVTAKRVMVVPGSHAVKAQAEAEGLPEVFRAAGADWREPGCSMCLAMNPDKLAPGERVGEHQQPQLRGPPGARRPHPPGQPGGGRGHRRRRPFRSASIRRLTPARTTQVDPEHTPARTQVQPTPSRSRLMKAVRIITGHGVPLKRSDVDTDQIIPAEWLKRVERTGFEKGLFSTWKDDRDFVLNDERYAGASILVAGPAFGVGSSREHAVWAIQQGGFDAVIAPSFSDIFRNNCTKNGLVPVVLPEATVTRLWSIIEADPQTEITVDMERLTVEVPSTGFEESFPMPPADQERYLEGLDDIGITLSHDDEIAAFERSRPSYLA